MKTQVRIILTLLLLPLAAGVYAQGGISPFNWQGENNRPFIGMSSVACAGYQNTNTAYASTIYAVGTREIPSDRYNPFATAKDRSGGIRFGHDNPDNPMNPEYGQTDYSPIGEPLVLVLFALLFAGVITYKKRLKKTNP